MTYEYAAYFKLLLLCGYKEELQQYIDNALMEQNPISDIILSLSFTGGNDKTILTRLNEYLLDADTDYNGAVFDLVLSFLRKKYHDASMSTQAIAELMYHIALYTERYFDEPWHTMYYLGDFFAEAEAGYMDKTDYLLKFDAFINNRTLFSD